MTRENVAVGDHFVNLRPGLLDEVFNPDPHYNKFIGDDDY